MIYATLLCYFLFSDIAYDVAYMVWHYGYGDIVPDIIKENVIKMPNIINKDIGGPALGKVSSSYN